MNVDDGMQMNATLSLGVRTTDQHQLNSSERFRSSSSLATTIYSSADGTTTRRIGTSPHNNTSAVSSHKLREQRKQRILGASATTAPIVVVPSSPNTADEGDASVSSITAAPDLADLLSDDDTTAFFTVVADDDSSLAHIEIPEIVTSSGRERLRSLMQAAIPTLSRSCSRHTRRESAAVDGGMGTVDDVVRNGTVPDRISLVETTASSTLSYGPTNPPLIRTSSHSIPSRKLYSYVDYDTARDRSAMDLLLMLGGQQYADAERGPVVTKRSHGLTNQNSSQQEQSDSASILNISRHLSFRSLCATGAVEATEDDGPSGLSRCQGRTNPFDFLDFQDGELLLDNFIDGADWTSIAVDFIDTVQLQMQRSVSETLLTSQMGNPLEMTGLQRQLSPQQEKRPAIHRSLFRGIEVDDCSKPSCHSRSESQVGDVSIQLNELFGHCGSSVWLLESSADTNERDLYVLESSSHCPSSDDDDDELHESLSTLQLLFGNNDKEASPSNDSEIKWGDSSSAFDDCFVAQQSSPSSCSSISASLPREERMNRVPGTTGSSSVEKVALARTPLRTCLKRPEQTDLSESERMKNVVRKAKFVKFDKIRIREYEMSIADNIPTCGVPVGLTWSYYPDMESDVVIHEAQRRHDRNQDSTRAYARMMSAKEREKLLINTWGIKKSKVRKARRKADAARANRNETRQEEIIKNGILFDDIRGCKSGNFRWLPDVDDDRWPLPKG